MSQNDRFICFAIGAMENFGCIIYRETRLYYNNRTSASINKQEVALVIAHEVNLRYRDENLTR